MCFDGYVPKYRKNPLPRSSRWSGFFIYFGAQQLASLNSDGCLSKLVPRDKYFDFYLGDTRFDSVLQIRMCRMELVLSLLSNSSKSGVLLKLGTKHSLYVTVRSSQKN